jgi:hypothetical protein
MKYLSQILIVICLFGCNILQAQNAISSSGGNAYGTGGTVNYTVGQVVYTASAGPTGNILQGCQQPYEIFVITGIPESAGINAEFEVYPNPSSDFVKLSIAEYKMENLSFRLYNSNGNLIQTRKIINMITVIEMGGLPPASYYLYIHDGQKEIKSFIIIKY